MRTAVLPACALAFAVVCLSPVAAMAADPPKPAAAAPSGLPLPSALPLLDYEAVLYPFIAERRFVALGWAKDKRWRDTGPFVLKTSYGVHPAVRMYYSPGVLDWLRAGRTGEIPDGAIVVKEMAAPPAARYNEYLADLQAAHPDDPAKVDALLLDYLKLVGGLNWTVMIKDKSVSKGGWVFSSVEQDWKLDDFGPPFNTPATGAGLGTCMRCHASADAELIFSDLANIEGYPGAPLNFRVDESWRDDAKAPPGPFNLPPAQLPAAGASEQTLIEDHFHRPEYARSAKAVAAPPPADPAFAAVIMGGRPPPGLAAGGPVAFPGQWLDHVPARPVSPQHFLTSDNCFGCHGGLGGPPSGTTMFLQTGPNYGDGYNISEYGEWRWTPMGLAGRDPVFFSQLESEFALLERAGAGAMTASLGTTCLSCHGAMGQRQLDIDAHADPAKGLNPNDFKPAYTLLHTPLTRAEEAKQKADGVFPYHPYGNLAREGISCAVCHHIAPPQGAPGAPPMNKLDTYLLNGTTGVFRYTPPDELIGPFADIHPKPMQNAMGIRPTFDGYVKDSELCGACHTINLPNVDAPTDRPLPGLTAAEQAVLNQAARNGADYLKREYGVDWPEPLTRFQHSVEQATYIEWINSGFGQTSCQDCHMPSDFETLSGDLKLDDVTTQIASIQDSAYPEVTNALPEADLEIPFRKGYRRHSFVGLNAFLLEMFKQFDAVLGIDKSDYMTGATNGADLQIETMRLQARDQTVDLAVDVAGGESGRPLSAKVSLTSKVGHRFPSGVGFRRAFLEVRATRRAGDRVETLWCSGCTNAVGVIVGPDGQPLKTEFLDHVPEGADEALYQPHHRVVTRQDQVQIYEELTQNAKKEFTSSFVHRVYHPKDNRLLPKGWLDPDSPAFMAKFDGSEVTAAFLKATAPEGKAAADPDFGAGGDAVEYVIHLPDGVDPKAVTVTATLYYQAFPPYFLRQRFVTAPDGPATQRLYYIASRLQTAGTAVENWKLKVTAASAAAP